MLKQVSARLEGGSLEDQVDVFLETDSVSPTGESERIDDLTYYRTEVLMSPVGGGELQEVLAKISSDSDADIFIEDAGIFAVFAAKNEAQEDAVDWEAIYDFSSHPSRFEDMSVRYLESEAEEAIEVTPVPFVIEEDFTLDDGLGHAWQVTAEVKRRGSRAEPVAVNATFYIAAVDGSWESHLEIDPDDLEEAEEEAEVEAEEQAGEQLEDDGASSNENYTDVLQYLQAYSPGLFINQEFHSELVANWDEFSAVTELADAALGPGWTVRVPVSRNGEVWKNDAEVAVRWNGNSWYAMYRGDDIDALNAGGDVDDSLAMWVNDPQRISEADIYIVTGGAWGRPEGEPAKFAVLDDTFSDAVPREDAIPDTRAWDVRAALMREDDGTAEPIYVAGKFVVEPDVGEYGKWQSYLEIDLEHPENVEVAGRLSAEVSQ